MKKIIHVVLCLILFCTGWWPSASAGETPVFPISDQPFEKFFVGEELVYTISYLGVKVGEAHAKVEGIAEIRGRQAYHIVVKVRSHPVIDLIYKVRDEHHSYVDTEKLYSLQYEKILKEGHYTADEIMTYDQDNHTAHYFSRQNKSEKEMFIPEAVQDQLSCGYFFRTLNVKPETQVILPVNADEKNWQLEIDLKTIGEMKLRGIGVFQALEAEPKIKFQGIFVKRGKIRGWISMDERRIPLKMKVKVPILGSVVAKLSRYIPGKVEA
ncbi:MAG: DUF3108 domain-containing protein [Candidatus Omnitrophica bacterium]|nr:DUF3108 domain-containing protein [Candidatus Omnitrophota bacterium]